MKPEYIGQSAHKGSDPLQIIWLALGYNVPINPSKNRVYVWRKLKELGAGYFKQGVAILPKSPQSLAQFRALAKKIQEMGGEATLAELKFLDAADEQKTIRQFREQSRTEYMELMRDCAQVMDHLKQNLWSDPDADRVRKVLKQYIKVKSRDFFKSGPGAELTALLDEMAQDIAHSTEEFSKQLRALLDEKL